MFGKLLIANRGEIACRVVRTAKALGLRTVAVFSEADRDALHVEAADEAECIGPAPAADSYLNIDAIVGAARRSAADAVHPGYGFLAENADFAEAVEKAGLVFVGPPARAIRAMGDKSVAKAIMEKAGVPVVPGYHGARQDLATLGKAAQKIGYPVLVKACKGGGGRGMRVVDDRSALKAAVAACRREAKAAFGDGALLVEKYLSRPRHVEVQIFADSHGNAVHLFERDCSIQRRHQKAIEEAPASALPGRLREEMAEAALAAARTIGYVGAGTVEFLFAEDGRFYFMEMNTRLQVEHTVTEMLVDADLVAWQLAVAAGETLPRRQGELEPAGHAIEARLYAEDPGRDFLPGGGRLERFRLPDLDGYAGSVRIDTGMREGDDIPIHYDPLIAKVIVWGDTRPRAVQRLGRVLADIEVAGVVTNLDFLRAVAAHPAFAAGDVDTGFIDRHLAGLLAREEAAPERILALACLEVLLGRAAEARRSALRSADPQSPWHLTNGWRLNEDSRHVLTFVDGAAEVTVAVRYRGRGFLLELPSGPMAAGGEIDDAGTLIADLAGTRVKATMSRQGSQLTVIAFGARHTLTVVDPAALAAGQEAPAAGLTAPMPGKVVQVEVKPGARVRRGATLVVLEAMKMEHAIIAPADGTVVEVHFAPGDQVEEGAELLSFDDGEDSP